MRNEIRIIGGQLKRSKLAVPDRPGLRPTPDRVRETLFNWLMPHLNGARVLDLYAGTGALGLEAISRGAAFAQLVEPDRALASAIQANAERLKVAASIRVDATTARAFLSGAVQAFDIVFIDPPYTLDLWADTLAALPDWLNERAVVYLEHPAERPPPFAAPWRALKESRAGGVKFWLLEMERAHD